MILLICAIIDSFEEAATTSNTSKAFGILNFPPYFTTNEAKAIN